MVGGKTLGDSNAAELGLQNLNRDLSQAQIITKDEDIGGLNATVTVDNRWFSEAGRQEPKQEQKIAAGVVG